MKIELNELTLQDGQEIFDMIKEIGPGENGFTNSGHEIIYENWPKKFLQKNYNASRGINLNEGHVPQTVYWLFINNKPVGISKLRHQLTEKLMHSGGHLGYCIRPTERGKGYGNIILQESLKKAKELGITEILLTCNQDNSASRKVIENQGGILENISPETDKCRYWVKL